MSVPLIQATRDQEKEIFSALSIEEDRHFRLLEVFKEWIKSKSHLPHNVDDSYLSGFLGSCKDDLVKAKMKFEASIIGRKDQYMLSHETLLTTEDFTQQKVARSIVLLPNLTFGAYRIGYTRYPESVKGFVQETHLKFWVALADTVFFEDKASGVIIVGDFANCTLEMVAKIDLSIGAQLMRFYFHGFPIRLKNYHIINLPAVAKPIVTMMKAVLPSKLKDRLLVHDDVKDLRRYFPEEMIPKDYGGTMTCLDDLAEEWEKYYLTSEEWMKKLKTLKLHGEVPKEKLYLDPNYGFGVKGSFRNLEVD